MTKAAVKLGVTVVVGIALGVLVARKRADGPRLVVRGVTIDRPPTQVYEFLHDPQRLLAALDERAATLAGKINPRIMDEEPGRMLSWRALDGPMPHVGRVRLVEAPNDRGTGLLVMVHYQRAVAGRDLDRLIRTNLRRIKQMLEAGTIIGVQGQPTGRGLIKERLTRKVQDKLTVGGRP